MPEMGYRIQYNVPKFKTSAEGGSHGRSFRLIVQVEHVESILKKQIRKYPRLAWR